jgi:hypothetical protein
MFTEWGHLFLFLFSCRSPAKHREGLAHAAVGLGGLLRGGKQQNFQGTFSAVEGTFGAIQGTFGMVQGTFQRNSGNIQHELFYTSKRPT